MPTPGPSLALQKGPGLAVFVDTDNPVPVTGGGTAASTTPITTGLVNGAATGAGTSPVAGGTYIWSVPTGTFSGATLQLQASPDGVNYLNVVGAVLTAVGQWEVDFGAGETVRVLITGGPPSGLTTYLQKVS